MIGDQSDMQGRLRAMLPRGWFPDDAPVLSSLLSGLAESWAWLYAVQAYVRLQTRLATASDGWLDMIAQDFAGNRWMRQAGETDTQFSARIAGNLRRLRGTRAALLAAVTALTGRAPTIFEPALASDTGGWGVGLGWNTAGGWGSLGLPYQCFVTVFRPSGGGIANVGGYGGMSLPFALGGWNTGALLWGDPAMVEGEVTDTQIYACVADCMPAAAIAWTAISN